MTLDEIQQALREIADHAGRSDDDAAHTHEDELYEAFVRHVAEVGPPELAEMAQEVLKTQGISFMRWTS
jgi:TRAP-type C4-dicarboxylate transport system substrate-binding protein